MKHSTRPNQGKLYQHTRQPMETTVVTVTEHEPVSITVEALNMVTTLE